MLGWHFIPVPLRAATSRWRKGGGGEGGPEPKGGAALDLKPTEGWAEGAQCDFGGGGARGALWVSPGERWSWRREPTSVHFPRGRKGAVFPWALVPLACSAH